MSASPADPLADELASLFTTGLPALGLPGDGALAESLGRFVRLLHKWNRAYNLTSVREPREMVIRHILDSLAVRGQLEGERVADIGCGAGLPGIPLALPEPGRQFVLVDSGSKKTRFVQQAILELGIPNATVLQARVEQFRPAQPFDTVICRAFTSLAGFVGTSGHLATPGGLLLAMKGKRPDDELADLPEPWYAEAVTAIEVPLLGAERHVVRLRRRPEGKHA